MDYKPVDDGNPTDGMSSRNLLGMSVISFIIYLLSAFLIFRYLHGTSIAEAFEGGYFWANQLIVGIAGGSFAAAMIALIVSREPISKILNDFYIFDMIANMRLTNFDRFQVSAFAGVGEELLFRGAIQPLLGNGVTSLLFIGIHGYFKFKSVPHILFGVTMFGLSMVLGYLFEYAGLLSAMAAHAIYDIIMLKLVQKGKI